MSDNTKPEDGTQGGPKPEGKGDGGDPPKPATKSFTQEELDRIVQDRVARAIPADYEEMKRKAAELDKVKEGEKTELQRAQEAAQKAQQERDQMAAQMAATRRATAIQLEAVAQGADPETVAAMLAQSPDIKVEGDQVTGVKEAVSKLLETKPFLKIGGPRKSGGEFGGQDQKTVAEKITELERKGDRESLAQARLLKIEQLRRANA